MIHVGGSLLLQSSVLPSAACVSFGLRACDPRWFFLSSHCGLPPTVGGVFGIGPPDGKLRPGLGTAARISALSDNSHVCAAIGFLTAREAPHASCVSSGTTVRAPMRSQEWATSLFWVFTTGTISVQSWGRNLFFVENISHSRQYD